MFWLITHPLFVFNVFFLFPLLVVGGATLWFSLTFTESTCPVCASEIGGLANGDEFPCLVCGNQLKFEDGEFVTAGPTVGSGGGFGGGGGFSDGGLGGGGSPFESMFDSMNNG